MDKNDNNNDALNNRIHTTTNTYWKNLSDFIGTVCDIVDEVKEDNLTELDINVDYINIGKKLVIGCNYNIYNEKLDESKPENESEYKQLFIRKFIISSYNYWDMILSRNNEFFLEHSSSLFSYFGDSASKMFKVLLGKDKNGDPVLDPDDVSLLWEYIESFIRYSVIFIHYKRMPRIKDGRGIYKKRYLSKDDTENEIIRDINVNIKKYKNLMKINLDYDL